MTGQVVILAYLMCCVLLFHSVVCMDYCLNHFQRCICTDENLECRGERKLTNGINTLSPYIKDHVTRVIITGSDLRELPENVFRSCRFEPSLILWELKTLDLSNNRIRKVNTEAFKCMPSLEKLVLARNDWAVDQGIGMTGYFTSLPNLRHLNLNNAFSNDSSNNKSVSQLVTAIFTNISLGALEVLELANNEIVTIGNSDVFCSMSSLKILDLSDNAISTPLVASHTASKCLAKLEYLDLTFNKIPRLTKTFIDWIASRKNLKSLKLGHNAYECDCNILDTFEWLSKTDIPVEHDSIICAKSVDNLYENKPVTLLDWEALDCNEITGKTSSVAVPDSTVLDCNKLFKALNRSQAAGNDGPTPLTPDMLKCYRHVYSHSGADFAVVSHVIYIALGLILAKC